MWNWKTWGWSSIGPVTPYYRGTRASWILRIMGKCEEKGVRYVAECKQLDRGLGWHYWPNIVIVMMILSRRHHLGSPSLWSRSAVGPGNVIPGESPSGMHYVGSRGILFQRVGGCCLWWLMWIYITGCNWHHLHCEICFFLIKDFFKYFMCLFTLYIFVNG